MTIADSASYHKCLLRDNDETENTSDSDSENTLMPPNTRHPPGRPKKKRVRSAADELDEDGIFVCIKFNIAVGVTTQGILKGHVTNLFDQY